jgi:pyruvate,orthophosphate dikinase
VLTSSGGLASHAAVVARGWGIPAVVGATAVHVEDGRVEIGGRRLALGDLITIDGGTGEVFAGAVAGERTVVPEAATLLAWAHDLGIAIGATGDGRPIGEAGAATPAPTAPALGPQEPVLPGLAGAAELSPDETLRALGIKGFATVESLAEAMMSTAEVVGPLVERLVTDGLAERTAGSFRLTVDGKMACRELIAADTARWGEDQAAAALEAFSAFDLRMKDTVTAWQMRDVAGEAVLNDHSDAAYDADVLDGLAALHADTLTWLTGIEDQCGRFAGYRTRLERALAVARAGDVRFVASPRVDSYHGVWFELHEELIRLANRRRSDEVVAGRA